MNKSIIRFVLFIYLAIFICLPNNMKFIPSFFYFLLALYILALVSYFKIKQKANYFDFDTIFIFINTIIAVLIPIYYGTDIYSALIGLTPIDVDNYLFKGTILALIGIMSYMNGSISLGKPIRINVHLKYNLSLKRIVFYLVLFSSLSYIGVGGIEVTKSNYNNNMQSMEFSQGMYQLLSIITTSSLLYYSFIFLSKQNLQKIDVFRILYIVVFSITLAIAGNRTIFSIITLPFLFCYFRYIKPIGKYKTILLFLIGSCCMYFIQITRQGGDEFSQNFALFFTDLTYPATNNYLALDYISSKGINFGSSFVYPLYEVIPGLGTLLGGNIGGSAELLTRYYKQISVFNVSGLGTTCVCDLYLSFGILGVVGFLYYLGYLVTNLDRSNLTGRIIECGLFSACVFMCRSSFLMPIKDIVWGICFVYILNRLKSN